MKRMIMLVLLCVGVSQAAVKEEIKVAKGNGQNMLGEVNIEHELVLYPKRVEEKKGRRCIDVGKGGVFYSSLDEKGRVVLQTLEAICFK